MTKEQQEIYEIFLRVGHEIRWPTAKWLCSDLTGKVDSVIAGLIGELISLGLLVQGPGGWLWLKEGE